MKITWESVRVAVLAAVPTWLALTGLGTWGGALVFVAALAAIVLRNRKRASTAAPVRAIVVTPEGSHYARLPIKEAA